jgi:hypothetical protein
MGKRIDPAFIACYLATACLAFCSTDSLQQKPESDNANAGIVYGTDHAFGLVAPPGWVLDNSRGVSEGLHAVFYPKGTSWKDSRVVMYANTVHKGTATTKSVRSIIADDIAEFKEKAKAPTVTDESPLTTRADKSAVVKGFVDVARNVYEFVAYVDEPRVVVMLVLSADTKQGAAAAMPAFKQLVASYFFISSKVTEKP